MKPNRSAWAARAAILAVAVVAVLAAAAGCNPYNRLAKSRRIADRDTAAFYFFRKEKFEAAAVLFEDLLSAYRGQPRASVITYYYGLTMMRSRQYLRAAEYFQNYVNQYPNSEYTEQALYNVAESFYLLSADWEKDQSDTRKAIEQYQLFASVFPTSSLAKQANERLAELRDRLAHKAYSHAELYYNIGQFRAAVVASKNVLSDHADSRWREPAQFKLFQSAVAYAEASIPARQEERYREALIYYERLLQRFPNSTYLREAERLYQQAENALRRIVARNAGRPEPAPADTTN